MARLSLPNHHLSVWCATTLSASVVNARSVWPFSCRVHLIDVAYEDMSDLPTHPSVFCANYKQLMYTFSLCVVDVAAYQAKALDRLRR